MRRVLGLNLHLPPLVSRFHRSQKDQLAAMDWPVDMLQRIPSSTKPDNSLKALKKSLEDNYSFVSPPSSPFIERPKISWSTESELRESCAKIVKNTGGEDGNTADPVLSNFARYQKHVREKDSKKDQEVSKQLRKGQFPPRSDSIRSKPVHQKQESKDSIAHDSIAEDVAIETAQKVNFSRPRSEHGNKSAYPIRRDSLQKGSRVRSTTTLSEQTGLTLGSIADRPRTAPMESSDVSVDTPMTGSTDRQGHHISTNITSAAYTPSRPSLNKPSHPQQASAALEASLAAVAQADAQAAEWMRQQQTKSQLVDNTSSNKPPPSRGRSFTSEIRHFIRKTSKSRDRTADSKEAGVEPPRTSTSQNGWHSWGFRRHGSKANLSEPSEDWTSVFPPRDETVTSVDLNRDLPPLPSLSTYKEATQLNHSTHIASLIRDASVPRPKTGTKVVDTMPKPLSSHANVVNPLGSHPTAAQSFTPRKSSISTRVDIPSPPPMPTRKFSIASQASTQDSCFSPVGAQSPDQRSIDLVKAAAMARSTENLRQQPIRNQATKSRSSSRAGSSLAKPPLNRYSLVPHQRTPSQPVFSNKSAASSVVNLPPRPATRDPTNSGAAARISRMPVPATASALNFSRKISVSEDIDLKDLRRAASSNDITALPPMPAKRQKGLRRMLSTLSGRMEPKPAPDNRVDFMEKGRIREEDEVLHAPKAIVVGY
jgi:hypothetical protein